jgi:hypothetical protein
MFCKYGSYNYGTQSGYLTNIDNGMPLLIAKLKDIVKIPIN